MVLWHTTMSKKKNRLGQNCNKLFIELARDSKGAKGSVRSYHAVEFPVFALLNEFSPISGGGGYEVSDVAQGFPCFGRAVCLCIYVRGESIVD